MPTRWLPVVPHGSTYRRSRLLVQLVGALVALVALTGCGSQAAPEATVPSRNSDPVPGTSPSATALTPAISSPTVTTRVAAPSSPTTNPRSFALADLGTGDFVAGIGSGAVVIGGVGIHGVGAAWATRRVTVRRTHLGLDAHYDGPARLQRNAPLQLGFAAFSYSGDNQFEPAHLRFEVHLDRDGLGHADVWIAGRHAHLVAAEPPHTADPVVAAVVRTMRAEDWSAMYDLAIRFPGQTRADFVRTFGGLGSISSLELIGDTVYRVADGVGYADTPAHIVATIGHRHWDRDVTLQLIYRQGEWRYDTLAKSADGN